MRNRLVAVVVALVVLIGTVALLQGHRSGTRIGVNQFMQHPLLDAVHSGFLEVVAKDPFCQEHRCEFIVKNANGDQGVANQINRQFVDDSLDLIVALGTPSAQSAVRLTQSIPVVFGAITDPVAAGIAASIEAPGGNKTGTTDRWPYEKQIALIKQLVPTAVKVGIPLNPGEANTEASMAHIRPLLRKHGMESVEVAVANTSEVYNAAKSLVGRCDALLIPGDNTVIAAADSVVKVANEARIPLFAGSVDCVEKGAVATYGNDYTEIGRMTGRIALRILRDKAAPGTIPVGVAETADLVINVAAAERQGVAISDTMLRSAARVIR